MTIIDMSDWRAIKEVERIDAAYAQYAKQQGKTVAQLEEEYLEHIDAQAEADPEFQLWRLSGQDPGYYPCSEMNNDALLWLMFI